VVNGSFTYKQLVDRHHLDLASNPLMRASRVPLKAGAWVPTPSAPRHHLTESGMPLERKATCMDVAASTFTLVAANCLRWGLCCSLVRAAEHAPSATMSSTEKNDASSSHESHATGRRQTGSAQYQGVGVQFLSMTALPPVANHPLQKRARQTVADLTLHPDVAEVVRRMQGRSR